MRKPAPVVVLICFLSYGDPGHAELCTIDAVPAATLLLPYFEVSLRPFIDDTDPENDDPVAAARTVDTLFSINNASAAPTVAHVTLWGDWALPAIDFDIYLTGYDAQTVSLANVLNNGNLPLTAHAASDPDDLISPHGRGDDPPGPGGPSPGLSENPEWDSAPDNPANPLFPGCDSNLPLSRFKARGRRKKIQQARRGLTGRSVGSCIGQAHPGGGVTDFIARGYITIDNVTDCNLLFPSQPGYFGSGLTSEVNQLWGDWFIVQEESAIGDTLVSIEAAPGANAFLPGDYTFYGRYVDGLATDQREPLATSWGSRYLQPSANFSGGTDLIVWRDSKCQTTGSTFECDPVLDPGPDPDPDPGLACCDPTPANPPWHPLAQTQVVAFDEEENATEICNADVDLGGVSPPPDPEADPTCFPIVTGRYPVGEGDLAVPYTLGWLYLNLNFTLGSGGECSTDGLFGAVAQSWVITAHHDGTGVYSVGFAATQFTSACATANPVVMGDLGGM